MKELIEMMAEMDKAEKKELVKDFIGWVCLVGMLFMLSVIGG